MSRRTKKSENAGMTTPINPITPLEPSLLGLLGTPPPRFEKNQAADDEADRNSDDPGM